MSKRKYSGNHPSSSPRNTMSFFSTSRSSPASLIAFYNGTGHDHRGRTLSDILRWNVNQLEYSHDYIQTLFPLPERSGVNDNAPIINREVFEVFRSSQQLREQLGDAFRKILWFYGFELRKDADGKAKVRKAANYSNHSRHWNARFDHNHLRITRIIRSLRVLGLESEALAFYFALEKICDENRRVSSRSRDYWKKAAFRQLNLRPDLDDDEADERIGPRFLWEFETARKKAMEQTPGTNANEDTKQPSGMELKDETKEIPIGHKALPHISEMEVADDVKESEHGNTTEATEEDHDSHPGSLSG